MNTTTILSAEDKLTYENYTKWAMTIRLLAMSLNVWEIIEQEPASPIVAKSNIALPLIGLNLSETTRHFYSEKDSPKVIWDRIRLTLTTQPTKSTSRLKVELHRLKMNPGEATKYFKEFEAINKQIEDGGSSLSLDDKIATIISNAHPIYTPILVSIEGNIGNVANSYQQVKNLFLSFDVRKFKKDDEDQQPYSQKALHTNIRKNKFRSNNQSCTFCHKPGHSVDNCWHKNKSCPICKKTGHYNTDCDQRTSSSNSSRSRTSPQRASYANTEPDEINWNAFHTQIEESTSKPSYNELAEQIKQLSDQIQQLKITVNNLSPSRTRNNQIHNQSNPQNNFMQHRFNRYRTKFNKTKFNQSITPNKSSNSNPNSPNRPDRRINKTSLNNKSKSSTSTSNQNLKNKSNSSSSSNSRNSSPNKSTTSKIDWDKIPYPYPKEPISNISTQTTQNSQEPEEDWDRDMELLKLTESQTTETKTDSSAQQS